MARTEVSLAVTWAVSPACWEPPLHQLLEKLPLRHIWKTCSNTEAVFHSVTSLFVQEGFCTLYCIARVQWRSSFVFRSTGISSNSSTAFCWLTSMRGPYLGSFVQRILCPVKVTSVQSSEPTLKSLQSLARTRCSISVPPVPKRSSAKRCLMPATDFPVARLPAMGIQHFLKCIIYFCPHARFVWDVACIVPLCMVLLFWFAHTTVQHVTASISSRRKPCHYYTVLCEGYCTSVGGHHSRRMQVPSIFITRITRKYWYSRLSVWRGSRLVLRFFTVFIWINRLVLFGLGWVTRFLVSNSFLSVFVVVDPVFVSLHVLVVTLNGRSRDFVDPRLLNFHLRPSKMNVEVFAHAI